MFSVARRHWQRLISRAYFFANQHKECGPEFAGCPFPNECWQDQIRRFDVTRGLADGALACYPPCVCQAGLCKAVPLSVAGFSIVFSRNHDAHACLREYFLHYAHTSLLYPGTTLKGARYGEAYRYSVRGTRLMCNKLPFITAAHQIQTHALLADG